MNKQTLLQSWIKFRSQAQECDSIVDFIQQCTSEAEVMDLINCTINHLKGAAERGASEAA